MQNENTILPEEEEKTNLNRSEFSMMRLTLLQKTYTPFIETL